MDSSAGQRIIFAFIFVSITRNNACGISGEGHAFRFSCLSYLLPITTTPREGAKVDSSVGHMIIVVLMYVYITWKHAC